MEIKMVMRGLFGIFLSIIFSTMLHELYHVHQLNQMGVGHGDICFFGHAQDENENFFNSAFGWVYGYTDEELDETIPTIISIVSA